MDLGSDVAAACRHYTADWTFPPTIGAAEIADQPVRGHVRRRLAAPDTTPGAST